MSTSNTLAIYAGEEVSLEQYIINCSYSFGAMRGLAGSDIPQKFEPSTYHPRAIEKIEKELAEFLSKSKDEHEADRQTSYEEDIYELEKTIADNDSAKSRYEAMIEKVKGWTPPTPDHDKLKEVAIKELEESIAFDCNNNWVATNLSQIKERYETTTTDRWIAEKVERFKRDIEYHEIAYKEEIRFTDERSKWVQALINSFTNN
jgi:hypothetical protein